MENILLDIGGKELYFDLDALSEAVKIDSKETEEIIIPECENSEKKENVLQIDVAKYEMYRELVGTILTPSNEIIDEKMGMLGLNSLSIPFKLSFNTLLIKGILKEL
jgi:hypothetical protein